MSGGLVQYYAVEEIRIGVESVFGQMKTIKETIVLMMALKVCNLGNVENRVAHVRSTFKFLVLPFCNCNWI